MRAPEPALDRGVWPLCPVVVTALSGAGSTHLLDRCPRSVSELQCEVNRTGMLPLGEMLPNEYWGEGLVHGKVHSVILPVTIVLVLSTVFSTPLRSHLSCGDLDS